MGLELSRRALLACALAAPAGLTHAQAQGPSEFVIPFQVDLDAAWIPTWIGSKGPFRFAISFGAEMNLIREELARQLKLERLAEVIIKNDGMSRNTFAFQARNFRLGDTFNQAKALLIGRSATDDSMDGSYNPSFRGYAIGLNFDQKLMRLRRGPPPAEGFVGIPFAEKPAERDDMRIRVKGEVDGHPVDLLLAPGGDAGLTLPAGFVSRHGLWDKSPAFVEDESAEPVGQRRRRQVRLSSLKIGPIELARPIGHLSDPRPPEARTDLVAGLGYDVLRRFEIWIDQDARMLYLKPNASLTSGYRYNRSGLFFVGDQDAQVASVTPNSAAAAAGLKPGDGLVVDPEPGALTALSWKLKGWPGETVDLNVLSDGKVRPVRLTLTELL